MKVSPIPEMPKPVKKAKAPRENKARLGTISILEYDDAGIKVLVSKETWYLKVNGELLIFSGSKHSFKCSWQMAGTLWACLYTSMPTEENILKKILTLQDVREFLAKNSKRKVPKDWIISQTLFSESCYEDLLQS